MSSLSSGIRSGVPNTRKREARPATILMSMSDDFNASWSCINRIMPLGNVASTRPSEIRDGLSKTLHHLRHIAPIKRKPIGDGYFAVLERRDTHEPDRSIAGRF